MNLELEIKKLYGSETKIYGPYVRKQDGRNVVLLGINNRKITKLLAKVMLEVKHGRILSKEETVDHIDENPLNDSFDNIQLLSREENSRKSADASALVAYGKTLTRDQRSIWSSGIKNGKSKISETDVEYWRIKFANNEVSICEIETSTRLERRTVENFIRGRSYKSSPGPISKIKMRRVLK